MLVDLFGAVKALELDVPVDEYGDRKGKLDTLKLQTTMSSRVSYTFKKKPKMCFPKCICLFLRFSSHNSVGLPFFQSGLSHFGRELLISSLFANGLRLFMQKVVSLLLYPLFSVCARRESNPDLRLVRPPLNQLSYASACDFLVQEHPEHPAR
jgi:hypothetical protein